MEMSMSHIGDLIENKETKIKYICIDENLCEDYYYSVFNIITFEEYKDIKNKGLKNLLWEDFKTWDEIANYNDHDFMVCGEKRDINRKTVYTL